jgi:hypothetical protein
MSEASRIGDLASNVVQQLAPVSCRAGSLEEAWADVVPPNLRAHCKLVSFRNGCLKIVASESSYLYELQLCKAALLEEFQVRCPGVRINRIDVAMGR